MKRYYCILGFLLIAVGAMGLNLIGTQSWAATTEQTRPSQPPVLKLSLRDAMQACGGSKSCCPVV